MDEQTGVPTLSIGRIEKSYLAELRNRTQSCFILHPMHALHYFNNNGDAAMVTSTAPRCHDGHGGGFTAARTFAIAAAALVAINEFKRQQEEEQFC